VWPELWPQVLESVVVSTMWCGSDQLTQRAMWPMFVVMRRVFGQHCRQVALADDEHPVGAFSAYGAHPPLRE